MLFWLCFGVIIALFLCAWFYGGRSGVREGRMRELPASSIRGLPYSRFMHKYLEESAGEKVCEGL
jgi:hypothetical protein